MDHGVKHLVERTDFLTEKDVILGMKKIGQVKLSKKTALGQHIEDIKSHMAVKRPQCAHGRT